MQDLRNIEILKIHIEKAMLGEALPSTRDDPVASALIFAINEVTRLDGDEAQQRTALARLGLTAIEVLFSRLQLTFQAQREVAQVTAMC